MEGSVDVDALAAFLGADRDPPYLLWPNFLDTPTCDALLRWVTSNEHAFGKASVIGDQSWRNAAVISTFPYDNDIRERLRPMVPAAARRLGIPEFEAGVIEVQFTCHRDGGYFRAHADDGMPETNGRLISWVLWMHNWPKGFSGGELSIGGRLIAPRCNTLIMFRSNLYHEILPVGVPSRAWRDGRWAGNGWVRAA
jgi:SM-20-related protein